MSDYMFMLENHLNAAQNRVLAEVQKVAVEENVNVFLTGGAVRDMLGGFPIRDLDFTVEGNALKLAKTVAGRLGAEIISSDANRRQLRFLCRPRASDALGPVQGAPGVFDSRENGQPVQQREGSGSRDAHHTGATPQRIAERSA